MEENNNPNQKDNLEQNKNQEQAQNIQQQPIQPQGGQPQQQNPNVQGQKSGQPNGPQAPKKKSNTGIIIAIVIGAILVLSIPIIIFLAFLAGGIIYGKESAKLEIPLDSTTSYYDDDYYNNTTKNTTSKNALTINSNSVNKNTTTNNTTSKNTTSSSTTKAKESTVSSPLKINEWGLASKYVSKYLSEEYEDTSYVDVPVRVTKVTRGEEADKIVRDWCDKQTFYKYEEPKANTEWVVFDYEVDLSDLTFDKGTIGTDTKISSAIKGLDGNSVKYNDITYFLSTRDISDSEYKTKPGVYKCQFIVTLPEGCTDYLVKLGDSYNGAESYFRVEK